MCRLARLLLLLLPPLLAASGTSEAGGEVRFGPWRAVATGCEGIEWSLRVSEDPANQHVQVKTRNAGAERLCGRAELVIRRSDGSEVAATPLLAGTAPTGGRTGWMEPGRELEFPAVDATGPLPVGVPGVATGASALLQNVWVLTEARWKEEVAKLPNGAQYSAQAWAQKCGDTERWSFALPRITSEMAKEAGKGWVWLEPKSVSWPGTRPEGWSDSTRISEWKPLAKGVEVRRMTAETSDGPSVAVQVRPAGKPETTFPRDAVFVFAYSWDGYEGARMPMLTFAKAEGFWKMIAEHYPGSKADVENWSDFEMGVATLTVAPPGKTPSTQGARLAVKVFSVKEAEALTEDGLLAELRGLAARRG